MQYIEIKNNLIAGHYSATNKPVGEQYKEVNNNFQGIVGQSSNWFNWDNKGRRILDSILIKEGIRKDYRGIYYNKETKEEIEIIELDIKPDENITLLKPIGDIFESWDGEQWVIDEIAKQAAIIERQVGELKQELSDGDYKVIKAVELGVLLEDIYPGETAKRQSLRDEINILK